MKKFLYPFLLMALASIVLFSSSISTLANGYPSPTMFSGWSADEGFTYNDISVESFNNKLFQAVQGTDLGIYTRYSTDGQTWSGWTLSGSTADKVTMIKFGNRLFQAVQGTDFGIYTRSTTDGINWTAWQPSGSTYSNVYFEIHNGVLHQVVKGTDENMYLRSLNDSNSIWSTWRPIIMNTYSQTLESRQLSIFDKIEFVSFNNRMYLFILAYNYNLAYYPDNGNNLLYWYSSIDGINWTDLGGLHSNIEDFDIEVYNNKLYKVVSSNYNRQFGYYQYINSLDTNNSWSQLQVLDTTLGFNSKGPISPSLKSFAGALYISNPNTPEYNSIITRYIEPDGSYSTSDKINIDGNTGNNITQVEFNGRLYQMAVGTDYRIYTRSVDGN